MIGRPPEDPEIRFWRFVHKTKTCWLWTGSVCAQGYGQFRGHNSKMIKAHVFSFKLHKGNYPRGLCICHTCDVPGCVRPSHLRAWTYQQNMDDMMKKGRGKWFSGKDNPMYGRKTRGFSGRHHTAASKRKMSLKHMGNTSRADYCRNQRSR